MRFAVLGPVTVSDGSVTLDLGGPKQRTVLAMLIAHVRRPLSVDLLIEAVYGDEAHERARRTIQTYMSNLRSVVGDVIEKDSGGWLLQTNRDAVDAYVFEDLYRSADPTTDPPEQISKTLSDALELWRGPPYADVEAHGLLDAESNRLSELRLAALATRIDADLAQGLHVALIGEIETLLAQHPFHERFRAQHMLSLYRAGRQKDALGSYQTMRGLLAAELGIEPSSQLQDLEQKILEHDPSLDPAGRITPSAAAPNNLPMQLTSLVGRKLELAEISKLLDQHRLITLTGAGGSGKTRLALQVARERLVDLPDGVWFVDLTRVTRSEQITQAVLSAMGMDFLGEEAAIDALTDAMAGRQLLILMDNCEHVAGGAAELIHALLQKTNHLAILATSREPLGITGELLYEVPPLAVPPALVPDSGVVDLLSFDSVRLFYERSHDAGVTLDLKIQGDAVAEVCRQVAGLPLALELAAGRCTALSPEELADRLGDQLKLLRMDLRAGDLRHATLEATIDWSWQLLTEQEQVLMARLSVFQGGWSLQAAEAVCGDNPVAPTQVLDLLTALVTRSLVVAKPEPDRTTRYSLLEPIRQFAATRLHPEETKDVKDRHSAYFRTFSREEGAAPSDLITTTRLNRLVEVLKPDEANMVAAIEWALERDLNEQALEIYSWGLCYPIYLFSSHYPQVPRWLEAALRRAEHIDPRVLLEAHMTTAAMGGATGLNTIMVEHAEKAVGLASGLHDPELELGCLWYAGEALSRLGRFDEAKKHLDRVRGQSNNPLLQADASLSLAARHPAHRSSRWELAQETFELLDEQERTVLTFSRDVAALFLSGVASVAGHYQTALGLGEMAIRLAQNGGFRVVEALAAADCTELAAATGDLHQGLRWLDIALAADSKIAGTRLATVVALNSASETHRMFDHQEKAHEYATRALETAERQRIPHRFDALRQRARSFRDQGRLDDAREICEHLLDLRENPEMLQDRLTRIPHVQIDLASIFVRDRMPDGAISPIRSATSDRGYLPHRQFLEALEALGAALALQSRFAEAARCLASAAEHRKDAGVITPIPEKAYLDEVVEMGRKAIGATAWDMAFEAGRSLHGDDLLEEVLHQPA